MIVNLTLDTKTPAFDRDGVETQVAWILETYARQLRDGLTNVPIGNVKLRDSAGEVCGEVWISRTD